MQNLNLGDKGGSGSGLVLECRGELLLLDVVSGQSVDSGLDENHSAGSSVRHFMFVQEDIQLGVLVGSVSLEVLSDRDGLLDEVVKVLGDGWGETYGLVLLLYQFSPALPLIPLTSIAS
jgi:hypothetical protein